MCAATEALEERGRGIESAGMHWFCNDRCGCNAGDRGWVF